MPKIAIIGTTIWGTTLGIMLGNKELETRLWARTKKEAGELKINGHGNNLLPGIPFPAKLSVTSSMEEALDGVKAVILAVPSQAMRQNVKLTRDCLTKSMLIISAAKGIEIGTNKRMSEVIADEISPRLRHNICVLSGPNLSQEIAHNLPAVSVAAAEDEDIARAAQRLIATPKFCVYTNTDVVGVELGGALKNIIALGAGIVDGLGYGDNAKAAFITRGLTEMIALGVALGANPLTFSGLSGLGDLIATCASTLSRNHYFGVELSKGRPVKEITESMIGVAEGVSTTVAARSLAKQLGIEMPITEKIYRVLYEGVEVREAVAELMSGETRHELSGRRWRLFSIFRRRKRVA